MYSGDNVLEMRRWAGANSKTNYQCLMEKLWNSKLDTWLSLLKLHFSIFDQGLPVVDSHVFLSSYKTGLHLTLPQLLHAHAMRFCVWDQARAWSKRAKVTAVSVQLQFLWYEIYRPPCVHGNTGMFSFDIAWTHSPPINSSWSPKGFRFQTIDTFKLQKNFGLNFNLWINNVGDTYIRSTFSLGPWATPWTVPLCVFLHHPTRSYFWAVSWVYWKESHPTNLIPQVVWERHQTEKGAIIFPRRAWKICGVESSGHLQQADWQWKESSTYFSEKHTWK